MNVDPITFAVIKSGLDSIVDDMAYTVVRIARSEIVKDVMDFSAALCDADGQMIAQAKTIALHLGAVPEAIEALLAKFGGDLREGDVVVMNDPYHGGMHLPDLFMFMPIFQDGRRRAFSVVICHHTDFGGRVPATLDELILLPGVGRKTANLVMILAFASKQNICVDTHVHRISNRMGWVKTALPEETEHALYKATQQRWWPYINLYLVSSPGSTCP